MSMSDPAKPEKTTGARGAGQSGGGPYPNPHTGKDGGGSDGYEGHGGQSEMEYHGTGRLGKDKVAGNANAPAKGTKPDPR
jgi:hypothetical protein